MDAHGREGQAAVAAVDTRPLAIGDRVTGFAGGRAFRGVLEAIDGTEVDVDVDGATVTCDRGSLERDTDG